MGLCLEAAALEGSAESAVGALETVRPTLDAISGPGAGTDRRGGDDIIFLLGGSRRGPACHGEWQRGDGRERHEGDELYL